MKINAFWFRRDLRIEDNCGLFHALQSENPVLCFFIFDQNILDKLSNRNDPRVQFIFQQIESLHDELMKYGSSLIVTYDSPEAAWKKWIAEYDISEIYCNRDYESYALKRDLQIKDLCIQNKINWKSFKDHVLFELEEVLKSDGKPYSIFTPYKNFCLKKLQADQSDIQKSIYLQSYPSEKYTFNFLKIRKAIPLSLKSIGFEKSNFDIPSQQSSLKIIKDYHITRDIPSIQGTSRLGIHFRFGTISIREKARKSIHVNLTYFSELLWRDFYSMILQAYPDVEFNSFRPLYNNMEWRNNEKEFNKWCNGETGFPIVDAGMRELNATGYMHNRVRMIVASFLVKNLLIDWRWGEAYFAEKLLDFDLASNNGGWQWAAGCGTDAAPYYRIFNPIAQQEKFDPKFVYVKKWIPEFGTDKYTKPMIDLKDTRDRYLILLKQKL